MTTAKQSMLSTIHLEKLNLGKSKRISKIKKNSEKVSKNFKNSIKYVFTIKPN